MNFKSKDILFSGRQLNMDEKLDDSDKENKANPLRYLWLVLLPLFFILLLLNLYNWQSEGKNQLHNVLTNLGFIFLGLAALITTKRKALHNTLNVIAIILLLTGTALWFFR